MFARLLLAILLAAFAGPSMAAAPCHGAGAPMSAGMSAAAMAADAATPGHRDGGAASDHHCIGCVPLPDTAAPRPSVALVPAAAPRPIRARLDLRGDGPPAAPPPRIG